MPKTNQILVDRYRLDRQLGQNASRQTWLATDIETQAAVVVKLLAFNPQMQWEESKLFEREAAVLQSLNHSQIPKYQDFFTLDSLPDSRFPWFGLVQTNIPGESLQAKVDRGDRFHESDIEKIARELLAVLSYLHNLNPPVLHRDIKPSNIIWGKDDRIHLVDFGAVQDQAAQEGATFTVVGTYGYVPIEQFGGRAVPASDLYALGMTLIHLVTGISPADLPQEHGHIQFRNTLPRRHDTLPRRHDTVPGALRNHLALDAGWINWLEKITAPNWGDRFPSAQAALDALSQRQLLLTRSQTPQPRGSKIKMKRSPQSLEFLTPARGRAAFSVVQIVGLVVMSIAQAGVLGLVILLMGVAWIGGTFAVWLLLAIALLLGFNIAPAFTRIRLVCDRNWLMLRHELFGICYRKQIIPLDKIQEIFAGDDLDRLEKTIRASIASSYRAYPHLFCEFQAACRAALVKFSDRLVIQASDRFYRTNLLSLAERIWLRDELLHWLKQARSTRPNSRTDVP
ncbi:serine/threonine protein kinase [Microcoleus sp. FACHB-1515]|uniref:serine/threonine protein kinase n=1 Tax=Cyanophyceae TaxID=3028117 RepID=UPI001688327C|nr:serine/threonine-protein kinase [Microcoleus sp. FACHB-1515]MBD2091998.1 serine/threonine protein kinase [Microcoleus sp. FACHB-1515]